ncbi:hypothetical protein [Kibdelosporangium phytohabitans]|uniref:Arsenate reductase n=1 Tax=Kibdelosporangium phytohabitans TaxID=860235 RepID=A0A0N9IEZ6_9PSEU|nr:hypothetical protein [Kibdelosporangium phytohabitans]ALG15081.1 hypothetical protein AOZ06_26665 [Kibdelosporangium phytohabitans]MBE1468573.1 hypothetical protein [Kibdelosporangium phytohabitans]
MSTGESDLAATSVAGAASWVPEACTLPTAEQPLREAEFDDLFAAAVRGIERPEPSLLRLELAPTADVAETVAGLVVRETACCSFFQFTLTATAGRLALEVASAPVEVLTALAARAVSQSAGTAS